MIELNSKSINNDELELIIQKYKGFDVIFNEKEDKK